MNAINNLIKLGLSAGLIYYTIKGNMQMITLLLVCVILMKVNKFN